MMSKNGIKDKTNDLIVGIMGVEFFNFLVARIFHVKIPGNERDMICIVQIAICTCMK